jgi:hypothetical protein
MMKPHRARSGRNTQSLSLGAAASGRQTSKAKTLVIFPLIVVIFHSISEKRLPPPDVQLAVK